MFVTADKFAVQYTAGTCGTMLTWFVNQHLGFPKITTSDSAEYDLELNGNGCQWTLSSAHSGSEQRPFQTVEDIKECIAVDQKTNEFSKICFKTFPHDIVNDIVDTAEMELAVTTLANAGVTKWIYPMFYKATNYPYETGKVANRKYTVIKARWPDNLDWASNINSGFHALQQTEERHLSSMNPKMNAVINKYGLDILYLDMAAILGSDDQEYNRLVNFLSTPRLTNWHSVLKSVITFWDLPHA